MSSSSFSAYKDKRKMYIYHWKAEVQSEMKKERFKFTSPAAMSDHDLLLQGFEQ